MDRGLGVGQAGPVGGGGATGPSDRAFRTVQWGGGGGMSGQVCRHDVGTACLAMFERVHDALMELQAPRDGEPPGDGLAEQVMPEPRVTFGVADQYARPQAFLDQAGNGGDVRARYVGQHIGQQVVVCHRGRLDQRTAVGGQPAYPAGYQVANRRGNRGRGA